MKKKIHILVVNDDGVNAPGIQILARHLQRIARVTIMAPDRNRSASSQSLTISAPLNVNTLGKNIYSVEGTPADCVHLATTGFFNAVPDMVVSGINRGVNIGDDVLYSGTVAAAIEGQHCQFPPIAISQENNQNEEPCYETAAKAATILVENLIKNPMLEPSVLNVNVPNLPWEKIKGFQVTRLCKRAQSPGVREQINPRGHKCYWIGLPGKPLDVEPGVDRYSLDQNMISVTPLHMDLTDYRSQGQLTQWLSSV